MKAALIGACVAAAMACVPSAQAAVRYADPDSSLSAGSCPQSAPCKLKYAIENAIAGDEVVLPPGTYVHDSTNVYIFVPSGVYIHGVAGQPRPRIVQQQAYAGCNCPTLFVTGTAHLRWIEVDQSVGGAGAIAASASSIVEQAVLVGQNGMYVTAGTNGVLRDAVVRATGGPATGIQVNGDATYSLQNVTVVAGGANAIALQTHAGVGQPVTATLTNVIARGTAFDLDADASNGATSRINVGYSNYDPAKTQVTGGLGVINHLGNNQSASPLFVNAASGDLRQAAASPTIDAGSSATPGSGGDVDGDPRLAGSSPDIGADEYVPPVTPAGPGTGLAPGGSAPANDLLAPVLASLSLAPRAFRAARRGRSIAASTVGTRVRYHLSETARVRFSIQRVGRGRQVGRRCLSVRRGQRPSRRCTRYRKLKGSFSRSSAAGTTSFRFNGRVGRRVLRPGRYRLVALATDAAANVAKPVRRRFRIVRP